MLRHLLHFCIELSNADQASLPVAVEGQRNFALFRLLWVTSLELGTSFLQIVQLVVDEALYISQLVLSLQLGWL